MTAYFQRLAERTGMLDTSGPAGGARGAAQVEPLEQVHAVRMVDGPVAPARAPAPSEPQSAPATPTVASAPPAAPPRPANAAAAAPFDMPFRTARDSGEAADAMRATIVRIEPEARPTEAWPAAAAPPDNASLGARGASAPPPRDLAPATEPMSRDRVVPLGPARPIRDAARSTPLHAAEARPVSAPIAQARPAPAAPRAPARSEPLPPPPRPLPVPRRADTAPSVRIGSVHLEVRPPQPPAPPPPEPAPARTQPVQRPPSLRRFYVRGW